MKTRNLRCAFYQGNRLRFLLLLVLTALTSLDGVLVSWLLGQIMDAVAAGSMERLMWLLRFTVGQILVFFLLGAAFLRLKTRFLQRAMEQYKQQAFFSLSQKCINAFSKEHTGRYLSMLTGDITTVEQYALFPFDLMRQGVMFVGAMAAIFLHSWWQALAVLGLCILPLVSSVLFGRPLARAQRAESDENERFVRTLQDLLCGFSVIKAFRAEDAARRQFQEANARLEEKKFLRGWAMCRLMVVGYDLCYPVMQFGVFFFMAVLAIKGFATVGTVAYFTNLINFILQPLQELPQLLAKRRAAKELIEKLSSLLGENLQEDGGVVKQTLERAIVLDRVSYSYGGGAYALRDISLELVRGKKYALVGGSGSGKSTLLKLLMGNFTDYQGAVTLDDTELRTLRRDCLYDLMGLVEQNVFLFDSTLRDNLTMFRPCSEEAVLRAVSLSGLSALARQKGFDCPCGENGGSLSGGERQRVSIARSLLRGTPVLLLDEATSALDAPTARQVMGTILDLEGLTEIVVTHRLEAELLEKYDGIIVMKDGRVQETGEFSELMAKRGYFYALYTVTAA